MYDIKDILLKKVFYSIFAVLVLLFVGCPDTVPAPPSLTDPNLENQTVINNKYVVYQMMTRLFGNTDSTNEKHGTILQNGVGKFSDITPTALTELKALGVTHVWYTGVLEHATMSDNTSDDADVVKGRAGSPYAIKDYYDVNPFLADTVSNRMAEFEALIQRTHDLTMDVIIDFVPNHIARSYYSDVTPDADFGLSDVTSDAFNQQNNYYYLIGETFTVPAGYDPLGSGEVGPGEDGLFAEDPAKVTGNNQFVNNPDINSWFETVKLNYGVDYLDSNSIHFSPTPDTWYKMRDILIYWVGKGVDGFRCDMAEMVPVEFWSWVIPQVKAVNSDVTFIAEIYNRGEYDRYLNIGKFDILYDKSELYDVTRSITAGSGWTNGITNVWTSSSKDFRSNMLAFMENHDEQRIASSSFAGDPWRAIPGMTLSATLNSGPLMIYFGQEVGEAGSGEEGFSGNDGRTTIFDYWGVPTHQLWVNSGSYDGGGLSADQQNLRNFYKTLLNYVQSSDAICNGDLYEVHYANKNDISTGYDNKIYSYLRYTFGEKLLIVVNFSSEQKETFVKIPLAAWETMGLSATGSYSFTDQLQTSTSVTVNAQDTTNIADKNAGVPLTLSAWSAYIFTINAL